MHRCGHAGRPCHRQVSEWQMVMSFGWGEADNVSTSSYLCVCVYLVALLSLWASGGGADLWKEDAFPKWGHFGWFGFKKQINSVQRPRRIKAKKMFMCARVCIHVWTVFFLYNYECMYTTLLYSMSVNTSCICVLLPAPDRHARMQSDSKTSATRLPGRLHQRQQRR